MAYDDFEDETLDAWTETLAQGGTAANSAAALKFGNRGMRFTTEGTGDSASSTYENLDAAESGAWNFYAWIRTSNISTKFYYTGHENGSVCFSFWFENDQFRCTMNEGNIYFAETPSPNVWYRFRITYDGATGLTYRLYDTDNVLLETEAGTALINTDVTKVVLDFRDIVASVQTFDLDNVCITSTPEAGPAAGATMNMKGYW